MTDTEKLTQNIIDIVKNVTNCNNVDISSSRNNLHQWDSMAYMVIISEVELKYKISITQYNIEQFHSIESIVNLISKQKK